MERRPAPPLLKQLLHLVPRLVVAERNRPGPALRHGLLRALELEQQVAQNVGVHGYFRLGGFFFGGSGGGGYIGIVGSKSGSGAGVRGFALLSRGAV